MSLESFLEEERLGVLQILEEATSRKASHSPTARRPSQSTSSMLFPDDPTPPRKTSSSMILEEDYPPASNKLKPSQTINTGSLRNNRSLSVPGTTGLRPVRSATTSNADILTALDDDLSDPFSNGDSFYYSSKTLRSALPPGTMTKREREELEKQKAGSRFSFWKNKGSDSLQPSRSPSRERSLSANPSASSNPNIDVDKLRLSQNSSTITGSTPSSKSLLDSNVSSTSAISSPSLPSTSPRPSVSASSGVSSYLTSFDLGTVANSINLDQNNHPPVGSRRRSSSSKRTTDDAFADLYKGMDTNRRLVDDDDQEEEYSEEETGSSSEDDTDSDDSHVSDDDDDDTTPDMKGLSSNLVKGPTESLMSAMEEERKSIENSKFRVKSLIDLEPPPGTVPPPSMAEYAAYKRRIIHPSTAFDKNILEDTPYTSDTEELLDARRAAKLPFEISTIHSSLTTKRMIRTMSRGENLPSLTDPEAPIPKTFVLGTDLSPEAAHALEWTIGTVLRDTNVLYVVCANEDELLNEKSSSSVTPQQQEDERLEAMTQLTNTISKLLKKTRLQVHIVIEVVHCKSPKHLLTAVIDHVLPTMVILGSRGRSALKGVLLGSFSNYIVERSAVPVMVARRKLHKTKHKDLNVRLANNLRSQGGLSQAIVD